MRLGLVAGVCFNMCLLVEDVLDVVSVVSSASQGSWGGLLVLLLGAFMISPRATRAAPQNQNQTSPAELVVVMEVVAVVVMMW